MTEPTPSHPYPFLSSILPLPPRQPYQWGILAGCVVYTVTVLVVLYLLVAGGSFKRMREQVRSVRRVVGGGRAKWEGRE